MVEIVTRKFRLALLGLWIVSGFPVLSAQSSPADKPSEQAEERVRSFIEVFNTGSVEELKAMIASSFAPSLLERMPVEQQFAILSGVRRDMGQLEIQSISGKGNRVEALVQQSLTQNWATLTITIEDVEPHRIARIGLGPGSPPEAMLVPGPANEAELVSRLDEYLSGLARNDIFSGSVLLARNGQVLYLKAFGEANKDFAVPNRTDTKFNLGSMNKMFTAVAIARLVEMGKLSWEDPLSKFLPDFTTTEWARKIQIRHLLSHTAGLGSYFNEKFMNSSRALYRTVDDLMKLAEGDVPAFEPGTRWQYSNTGFLVLGAVIEKVTGQDYFDFIREQVYQPAKMENSDCYELDRVNPNLAVGYEKETGQDGRLIYRNNIFMHVMRGGPAGGGYSTVEDLLAFDQALRSGKLASPETARVLWTPKPELNSPNYGFGFGISDDGRSVGHSGGFPGINSELKMYLDSGFTVAVMSNYGRGAGPLVSKLDEWLRTLP